jgi:hypothetical protein
MAGFTLTNRRVCLSLMQELLLHADRSGGALHKEQQGALFTALLYLNGKCLVPQEGIYNWDGTGDETDFLNLVLPSSIASQGIRRIKDYQVQLMKAYYFFEFCADDPEYKIYLESFLHYYHLTSAKAYINHVLHPYLTMMTRDEPVCKFIFDPAEQGRIDFFEQFVINDQEIITGDYKTLRAFPVFKGQDNGYTVLFNNFLIDKFYQGFLFDFSTILIKAGHTAMTFGKLKKDMGERFSEPVLFYRAMSNCFVKYGQVRHSGNELRSFLKDAEPDYYIRDGRKVFLFEFKDVLLRADAKNAGSAEVIREELAEKLEESKKDRSKKQSKAIRQLLNSIETMLSGAYRKAGVDELDPGQAMIYPVLVHTDVALETEGVNYLLKERLKLLIREKGLPAHRIKDLVLINIDMLLSIQDLFADRKITLAACINDYLAYMKKGGPVTRMMPFDEFLKYDLMKKKHSFLTVPRAFKDIIASLYSA